MGKPKSPEHRAKISDALRGRVFTPEWRAKLSEAMKRRGPSPALLATAGHWRGRSHTLESRQRLSEIKLTGSAEERFWARVDKGDGCWEWTGCRDQRGYGMLRIGSRVDGSFRIIRAHRFSYELQHGPLASRIGVLHTCDNPPCVRPDHLFAGSQASNIGDMYAKGRKVRHTALTWPVVREIRAHRAAHGTSFMKLSQLFGIPTSTIAHIINGRTWKEDS